MRDERQLNGCDYLMLGFDHELRREGFAGNACQVILELRSAISPAVLERRVAALIKDHPVLQARPGGIMLPKWKPAGRSVVGPQIRVHRDEPGLGQKLFNEPLAVRIGELVRFDLVERGDGRMGMVFTWAHALMDAPGAEQFLALIGREDLPPPAPPATAPRRPRLRLRERGKLAWKNLHQLDEYCRAAPKSFNPRRRDAPALLQYRVETFTAEETARARANGVRLCGMLGDGQYHAAVAVLELHQLHQRLGSPSPSYVLPVPVGLRPKGGVEPLFSNQVGMLMLQFLPEHLDTTAHAAATLKTQMEQAMRGRLLESGLMLSEMFRFLPLPVYMAILKRGLRGEICSLFYGDTAAVNPLLTSFLGAPVTDFVHVAAVTPSPGLGVIFYYFRGELRVTVLHSSRVLTDDEAAGFAAGLRARLLNP